MSSSSSLSPHVGLIIGVVVAVIVVVVAVIVCVKISQRRSGMPFWKTLPFCIRGRCHKNSQPHTSLVEETSGVERDDENNTSPAGNHNDTPYSLTRNTSNAENSLFKPKPVAMTMNFGSDYNHLDYDQKPGKAQQQIATPSNDYNHTKTTGLNSEGLLGAYTYSLSSNPDGHCQIDSTEEDYQNIAVGGNCAVYQESLNAAGGVYHILDEEPSYTGEPVRSSSVYNVPDDVDEDVKDVLVEEDEDLQGWGSASLYSQGDAASLSVYHLPDETLKSPPNAKHTSVTYYNLQGPIAAAVTSAATASASEISQACKSHVVNDASTEIHHHAPGEISRKPHARQIQKPRTKTKPKQKGAPNVQNKPPTPTKPKPSPCSAFQVVESSVQPSVNVYHILEPQGNEALDEYSDGSNVTVVESSGARNNTTPSSNDNDEYNSLAFEGKKGNFKRKVAKSGSDNSDDTAVYNHLNGTD
jgi:hypothetical protein